MSKEIDKLVAVHVMENRWPVNIAPSTFGPDGTEDGGRDIFGTPEFSTDIAAAWAVVEKMREGGWQYQLREHVTNKSLHVAYFVLHQTDGNTKCLRHDAPTPMLAICLAALRALGIDIHTHRDTP